MANKKYNFGAGPCILPDIVLNSASDAVKDYNRTGLSILEISHRSSEFENVINECQSLVRELLEVPDDYSILFLQGGASTQFSMVPMCLMQPHKRAAYLDTGYFSLKAIKEAMLFGPVHIAASSKDSDYDYIPYDYHIPAGSAYFHCTSNNSIEGTEIFAFPETDVPIVCDMSSDIFSREINVADFDLIYAGAQKNMGPAGLTLVIVKKALLQAIQNLIPSMSDYRIYDSHNSMFNTPPVFSIYVTMLNLRWLKEMGGVKQAEQKNIAKANLLYDVIDSSNCFYGLADKADRSRMNVTFKMYNREREAEFLNFAESRGVVGIGGFRSSGGFRASLYNAMDISGVEVLVHCMNDFANKDLFRNFKLKQI
nr:3-phosphoserine/phosphohydroxythreonine transaminase [uncultured Pedobacter sp.]